MQVHLHGLSLSHIAGAKVDAVSGQADCGKIQTGLERHSLHTQGKQSQSLLRVSSLHLTHTLCLSHLKGVVAVADQEVLLELQRPLTPLGLNEGHAGRQFLLRLVCVIQE